MAASPAGNSDNISIGDGLVLIGDAGATPTTDFGFIAGDGITLSYETQTLRVANGTPRTATKVFVTDIDASLTFTSQEWNFENFRRSMVGTYTPSPGAGQPEILTGGLTACPEEVSLQVIHCIPCVDHTITWDIYRAQSDGSLSFALTADAAHTFDFNFSILLAATKWDGTALAAVDGLFEMRRLRP